MPDQTVLNAINNYRARLAEQGIPVDFIVLFGSQATGRADAQSDIDLMIVSPIFDLPYPRSLSNQLWRLAARVDSRIEPIPCGSRQWFEDDGRPLIEQVRRQGIRIA